MSDGDIAVNSAMDLGTEFEIIIPAVAPPTRKEAEIAAPELPHKNGALALLVDDQEEVRAVLRRDLVALGYGVLEAEHAAEAMDLLDEVSGVELVLSDIAMPGGDERHGAWTSRAREFRTYWPDLDDRACQFSEKRL